MKQAALLIILTVVAYLPALRAGWIWDDDYYVTKNYNLRDAEGLKRIWTRFGLRNGGTPQYYPVTHSTFWVEHRVWGLRPAGYHAVNILLHATNAVLLWLILKRLGVPGAWVAAAVFAAHPAHVESVAWVTERKNVLSGFFYLAALLAYFPWIDNEDARPRLKPRRFALVLGLFMCALLSKSVTASLPAAILLIVWWKRGRIGRHDIAPLIPMFVLGLAMAFVTSWMEREHVGAQGADWALTWPQRVLVAGRAVWFYATKLVAPVRLSFIYTRWDVNPAKWWQWLYPIAAVALVGFSWAMRKRWGLRPLVAILFFGGTLVPALGFVDLLPMRYSFVADHFQYMASIGLIVLIVATAAIHLRGAGKPVAIVVLAALVVLTFRQTFVYENLETLWRDTIAKNPTGWMPRTNLATLKIAQEKYDEAGTLLTQALEHNPDQAEVLLNLGVVAERRGRKGEAFDLYQRSAQRQEGGAALANMGSMLLDLGLAQQAEELFRRAVDVEPTYARAHRLLGLTLANRQDFSAAAAALRRSTELDPDSADGWFNLGVTLEKVGDLAGAADSYERALRLNSSFEQARRNLERVQTR